MLGMMILINVLIRIAISFICFIIGIAIGIGYEKSRNRKAFKLKTPTERCEMCKKCKHIVRFDTLRDSVYCGNDFFDVPDKCAKFKPSRTKFY